MTPISENDWEDVSSDADEDEEVLDVDANHISRLGSAHDSDSDDPSESALPLSLITADHCHSSQLRTSHHCLAFPLP